MEIFKGNGPHIIGITVVHIEKIVFPDCLGAVKGAALTKDGSILVHVLHIQDVFLRIHVNDFSIQAQMQAFTDSVRSIRNANSNFSHVYIDDFVLCGFVSHIHTDLEPSAFFRIHLHDQTRRDIGRLIGCLCFHLNRFQNHLCIPQSIAAGNGNKRTKGRDLFLRKPKLFLTAGRHNDPQVVAVRIRVRQKAYRHHRTSKDRKCDDPKGRFSIVHHRLDPFLHADLPKGKGADCSFSAVHAAA